MIWFLAFAAAALVGCNSDGAADDGEPVADGGADFDAGIPQHDAAIDVESGTDYDSGVVIDAGPDIDGGMATIPGCNTNFFKPGCKISDIDVYGKTIALICEDLIPGETNKKFFTTQIGDPMQHHSFTPFNATPNAMAATYDGGQLGSFSLVPQQIQRGSIGIYEGEYYSVFSGVGPTCLSGITFNIGGSKHTSTLDDYDYPALGQQTLLPQYWRPCDVKSSLITRDIDGAYKMWFPASVHSPTRDIGIVRVYDLPPDTPYDFYDKDGNHEVIFLSGKQPAGIAKVPTEFYDPANMADDYAAILNSAGFGSVKPDYGIENASIDIVRLNHLEPQDAVRLTIDLGTQNVFPMKELPMTADGRYALVVGDVSGSSGLMVVNVEKGTVDGTLQDDTLNLNDVKDVAIKNDTIYVAVNDEIRMYDISDPTQPVGLADGAGQVVPPIPVTPGLSQLTVDEDGYIYAVVTDPDDPAGTTSAVYAIDPSTVTAKGCQ